MHDYLRKLKDVDPQKALLRLVFAIAVLGLSYNILVCWKVYRHEPLREAASRSLMASETSFFFDSGLSEPVPVFALKAAMAAGVDPDVGLRAGGVAAFVLLFFLTFFILRRRCGEICALMASLFLAANPYAGYYAMQGDSHLYALLFLLPFWYYFCAPEFSRRNALIAGFSGGLACLSRLDAVWPILIIVLLSLAVRRGRLNPGLVLLSLFISLTLASPYLIWQKARYGNPLYAQELNLRRWANVDVRVSSSSAPPLSSPISPAAFLFRKGLSGTVSGIFGGFGRAFSFELPRIFYYKFVFVLVFLGFYAAFVLKQDALLFFIAGALAPVLPFAEIAQVRAVGGIELRYYLWPLWGLCAIAGFGFQETLAWLEGRMMKWTGPMRTPAVSDGHARKNK